MSLEVSPRQMLVSLAFIVAYSALAAILGRSWVTFAILIVLFVAFTIFQARRQEPPFGGKADPSEVEGARMLYSEGEARKLQMSDEGIASDFQAQTRVMMQFNILIIIGLAYFILLWDYVDTIHRIVYNNIINNETVAHFIAFLAYFTGYFAIFTVGRVVLARRIKEMLMLTMPSEYKVTERGLAYKGLLRWTYIRFPLPEDTEVRFDEKRKFVELRRKKGKTVYVLRLYASNPKRLLQVIQRYGFGSRGARRGGG